MKKRTLGILFVLLALVQFFLPWAITLSSPLLLSTNTAHAQQTNTATTTPKIGYQPYAGTNSDISGIVFVYVDVPESTGLYYGTDVDFYVNTGNYENKQGADTIFTEIIDSDSNDPDDMDWEIEVLTINGQSYRRHYYLYGIEKSDEADFPLYISALNDDANDAVFEETTLTLKTYLGPTLPQNILNTFDGVGKDATGELSKVFSVTAQANARLSDVDNAKIVGEFKISIVNKYSKWQDTGTDNSGKNKADNSDDYGGWDYVYDSDLDREPRTSSGLTPTNSGSTTRGQNIDFDGFILDISTSADFKGNDTKSININPLILDNFQALLNAGTIQLTVVSDFQAGLSEITKIGEALPLANGLSENTTYYYRVRVYPDWSGVEPAYIAVSGSLAVPAKSSLTVIQNSRNDSELTEKSGQADSLSWLPECDALSASTWFTGCLVRAFYYLLFVPTSYMLALAGMVLDWILSYSISSGAYKAGYIVDGWRFIRDVCNLFFIFILIYLAFKLILNIGHGTKQLIVNTIIVATVINFSYPVTTVIIDASNITARQLYYNAFQRKAESTGKPLGLSETIVQGYDAQRLVLEADAVSDSDIEGNKGSVFMILLIGVIFNIVAMVVFLKIAVQFIYRIVGLVFAIILSPLAIFSFSLSSEQRGKMSMVGFEGWVNGLVKDAFKAPVFLFLILLLVLFVNSNPFDSVFKTETSGIDWWMSFIIPFMMMMAFLYLIYSVTKSMTSSLAEMAGGLIMKGVSAVASVGMGVATGGAAMLGRGTIGKMAAQGASKMRSSNMKDTWYNRAMLRGLDRTAKSSFDVRQTKLGNVVAKETGMDMDAATRGVDKVTGFFGRPMGISTALTAGGYKAAQDRKRERAIKRSNLLKHNEGLENDLKDQKSGIEDEIKGMETENEGVKNELKILTANLKKFNDAFEKEEKKIDKQFDTELGDRNRDIQSSDQLINSLKSQLLGAKTPEEKRNIEEAISKEEGNRQNLVIARNSVETKRQAEKDRIRQELEGDETRFGKDFNRANTKAKITELEGQQATINKNIEKKKFGEEIIGPDGKKTRVGGLAEIDRSIERVKNDRKLRVTLNYERKKTGDKIEVKTYEEHFKELFGEAYEAEAIKHLGGGTEGTPEWKEAKEKWEKLRTIAHTGYTVDKSGKKKEVSHLVDEDFNPEEYKNKYKEPPAKDFNINL